VGAQDVSQEGRSGAPELAFMMFSSVPRNMIEAAKKKVCINKKSEVIALMKPEAVAVASRAYN
jgi:hypothetical protein